MFVVALLLSIKYGEFVKKENYPKIGAKTIAHIRIDIIFNSRQVLLQF